VNITTWTRSLWTMRTKRLCNVWLYCVLLENARVFVFWCPCQKLMLKALFVRAFAALSWCITCLLLVWKKDL
jgi:hypothetical protein